MRKRIVPLIYQRENSECLLACIAMLAKSRDKQWTLREMRHLFPTSARGSTTADGVRILARLGFEVYATRVDLEDLDKIDGPVILHWKFEHYVVFVGRLGDRFVLNDPALGRRVLGGEEFSRCFTGVAIVVDGQPIAPGKLATVLRLRDLLPFSRWYLVISAEIVTLAIAFQAAVLLVPVAMKRLFDSFAVVEPGVNLLLPAVAALCLLSVYAALSSSLRQWAITRAEHVLAPVMAGRVFDRMFSLPPGFLRRRSTSELASRFGSVEAFRILFAKGLVESLIDLATLVFMLSAALILWSQLAAMTSLAALSYALVRIRSLPRTKLLTENLLNSQAKFDSSILETIRGYHVVHAAGAIGRRREHWSTRYQTFLSYAWSLASIHTRQHFWKQFIPALELTIVLAIGASAVYDGGATIGTLVAFLAYRQSISDLSGRFAEKVAAWKELDVHLERLGDIWEPTKQPSIDLADSGPLVSARNVSYTHPGDRSELLLNVFLDVEPGKVTALHGTTGSGKSTLLSLLLGHTAPDSGCITWHESLGSTGAMSVIFQDDVLFDGTIAENVTLGEHGADPGLIEDALAAACLLKEVRAMPTGVQSQIGEGGAYLSGGQRQRLLIARALFRKPVVLVMDEATSHLDVPTERDVLSNIKARVGAVLVVSHRPETIASADMTYHLRDGTLHCDRPMASPTAEFA